MKCEVEPLAEKTGESESNVTWVTDTRINATKYGKNMGRLSMTTLKKKG